MLYAILKDQKRTKGKMRLSSMLRSERELRVFAVQDKDLQKFCEAAKQYGILYCVLKDKNPLDGMTEIMAKAEDAAKINHIFERFKLATVDMASVKTEDHENQNQRRGGYSRTGAHRADRSRGFCGRADEKAVAHGGAGADAKPHRGPECEVPSVRAYLNAQRQGRKGY